MSESTNSSQERCGTDESANLDNLMTSWCKPVAQTEPKTGQGNGWEDTSFVTLSNFATPMNDSETHRKQCFKVIHFGTE